MNYRIINGAVSYGADTVLEEIDFEIKEKDKIAIVGRNGCGKTTLLNAIINNEMLEEGTGDEKFHVYKQGSPVIGYQKQIDFKDESRTLLDEVLEVYKPIIEIENKMKKLEEALNENPTDDLIKEYSKTRELYEIKDGYTYRKEYQTMIRKFGFSKEDESKKVSEFSGGQRTRIAFIKLLISKPDILLLDEPTNHLDIETIEWLETYLKNYPKAVVIVSHDRMFLNKIVNKVYEIEYGVLTEYTGNYTSFEEQKKVNYEKQLKDFEFQQKEIKRLMALVDRFRYKASKAKMAQAKLHQIERMTKLEEPNRYDLKTFHTNFALKKDSGKNVLSVKDLKIGYSNDVPPLADVSFNILKGQKLGIIGANGTGKSTLLKTLTGNVEKLSGNYEYGYNVNYEYFDQDLAFANVKSTVFDEFLSLFPKLNDREIRSSLASFLFTGEDVFKEINVLSGGEKVRLKLCEIFKKGPNLLFLDEPTNHMDIVGKESLERILTEYKGTLVFVSHDRYFVNKIADSLLIFEDGKVKYFDGTYDEYLEKKAKNTEDMGGLVDEKRIKSNNELLEKINNVDAKPKNDYLRNKEKTKINNKMNKIEAEIEKLEAEIESIKSRMQENDVASDYIKLTKIQEEINQKNKELDIKMQEWSQLAENLETL